MSDSLVIIPTYNEKENVERMLRTVFGLPNVSNYSAPSVTLEMNYDLGGGAVVMAGYGSDSDAAPGSSTYSIGLGLSF